jgi:putative flippase GtrA
MWTSVLHFGRAFAGYVLTFCWDNFVDLQTVVQKKIVGWLKNRILLNAGVIKYGVVGCTGILVNLGTMALLLTISSKRNWVPSAMANIVSTLGNFIVHNLWTFSDRRHQGWRLIRGFLLFAFMSLVGIFVATAAYVGFTRIAVHLTITNSHPGGLGVALVCQFVAILSGASISYALNQEFTWPRTRSAPAETTQVKEI